MRYSVVSDIAGRLRLKLYAGIIEPQEAQAIVFDLKKLSGVHSAEVHSANRSVLLFLDDSARTYVYEYIASLDIFHLPSKEPQTLEELSSLTNDFTLDIAKLFVWKGIRSLFFPYPLKILWTVLTSLHIIAKGLRCLFRAKIQVEVLDGAAVSVALLSRSYSAADTIVFLLRLSDILQAHIQKRVKYALAEGLVNRVESVWQVVDGKDVQIAMGDVKQGFILHLQSGQMLPVDGCVVRGEAELNESSMTGESRLVHKTVGHSVYAGTALEDGDIHVRVTAPPGQARLDEIISLVENSSTLKAAVQSKAEHLADALVPWSLAAFFGVLFFTRDFIRASGVLMVDYSCAIKLSTPIAVMSAMREAAQSHMLIKGGKYLEALAEADTIVFDKTGTLTVANPQLKRVITCSEMDEDTVLRYAACIEEHFPHSVARAIVEAAKIRGLLHENELHTKVNYIVAHGISTCVDEKPVLIGSAHFIFEDENIPQPEGLSELLYKEEAESSHVFIAMGGILVGVLCIADPLRPEAKQTISELRGLGIKNVVMLTGDSKHAALTVAHELGIDTCYYQLLPEQKSAYIEKLRKDGHHVIMVGDGINDSPALAAADVSVALADATDIARAVADVSVRDADLHSLITMRILAQRLAKRINNKYRLIVSFNSLLIILGVAGVLPPTAGALMHNASTIAIAAHNTTALLDDRASTMKTAYV